jgi:hypothetical protein
VNRRWWAAVLVALGPCAACVTSSSAGDAGTSRDAGLDADQPEAPVSCVLDAGTCPTGCNAIQGELLDLARKCYPGTATVLGCLHDGVIPNDAIGCLQRSRADGTVETFETSSLFGASVFGPNFVDCSAAVQSAAEEAEQHSCP